MSLLSIVVPCYNEEETVQIFYDEVTKVVSKMNLDYEIIYVNDGSKDRTIETLQQIYEKHPEVVKVIDFSRNFGKEAALLAGLKMAKGDFVTVMDSDLQDPPSYLPKMFDLMEKNEDDVVGTRRVTRVGESKVRTFFAKSFYRLANRFSEVVIVDGARDFRLMKRPVVDAILSLKEYNRFSKGMFVWVGFKCEYLEYENVQRVAGTSSWSFKNLFIYALDGIIEYTNAPLVFAAFIGGFLTVVMLIELIVLLILSITGAMISTSTMILSSILLFAGVILLAIGVVGMYLAKTYDEVRGRPNYIIKKTYE